MWHGKKEKPVVLWGGQWWPRLREMILPKVAVNNDKAHTEPPFPRHFTNITASSQVSYLALLSQELLWTFILLISPYIQQGDPEGWSWGHISCCRGKMGMERSVNPRIMEKPGLLSFLLFFLFFLILPVPLLSYIFPDPGWNTWRWKSSCSEQPDHQKAAWDHGCVWALTRSLLMSASPLNVRISGSQSCLHIGIIRWTFIKSRLPGLHHKPTASYIPGNGAQALLVFKFLRWF